MVLRGLKPILFIVIFTAVLNLFYTPGTYIFQWHFLHISVEGVKLAIFMVLRLMLLIIATSMLTYITDSADRRTRASAFSAQKAARAGA